MYKNILFLFCTILIISAVRSQSNADTVPKSPNDNSSQYPEVKEPILNPVAHGPAAPTIYSTFIPQDAVQQYVTQYGAGYTGQALEGFLIPTYERQADYEPQPVATIPSFVSVFRSLLPAPRLILSALLRVITFVASAIGVLFFGTVICSLTPICNPLFPVLLRNNLSKETKEIVEKIGEEVTPERIKRAADFLSMAVAKYQQIQKS